MISPDIVPRPLLRPIYEMTLCSWTPENPRHDHQLIFALDEKRLLLAWSEHYATAPRHVFRTRFDKIDGFGDQAACRISGRISEDSGRSWSPRFTIQENLFGLNVKHPNITRLGAKELLFTFTAWESEAKQRNVYMKRSDDDGESWSTIERISDPGWYCTKADQLLRLKDGRILLPAHGGPGLEYEGMETKLHSFMLYSDDEGKSWDMSADSMTASGRGAHSPTIAELSDGRVLCFLRTTEKCIYRSVSADQGVHWSTPVPTDLAAPDSPPLLEHIADSKDILLIWNNFPSSANDVRTPLTCAISSDDGDTWDHVKDIDRSEDHDAAYASVTFHGDEALVTYYSRGTYWARDCEIVLKIFKISQFYD